MVSLKVIQRFLFLLVATVLVITLVAVLNSRNNRLPNAGLSFTGLPNFYQETKSTFVLPDFYPTSPLKVAMSRKTRPPLSWLIAVQDADRAFVGEARLVQDAAVSSTETSFRGKGYRLIAQVNIDKFLFGSGSEASITLDGETQRAPTHRLNSGSSLFPPDALHQIPYWDYAQADMVQPVLVVLANPVVIVSDPEADLLEAIQLIKSWLECSAQEQRSQIIANLSESQKHPVAYVAGFECLMNDPLVLPELFGVFDNLPARPGSAIQGIVDKLYLAATGLTDATIKSLAEKLLESWSRESDPAALSSYLVWFDAHRSRTWQQDRAMKDAVLTQAERAKSIQFSGKDADLWEERVQQYALMLLN